MSTRRVRSPISLPCPPMTPARPSGPRLVADEEIVGIELARHAVERDERFARARAAHDDGVAAHLVEIEGVDGMAELEEDEVGDVDDVGDGAHPEARQAGSAANRARDRL